MLFKDLIFLNIFLIIYLIWIENLQHMHNFTFLIFLDFRDFTNFFLACLILISLLFYILKNVFDIVVNGWIITAFRFRSCLSLHRFISHNTFRRLIWIVSILIFYLSLYFVIFKFSFLIIIQIQYLYQILMNSKAR